MGSMSARFDCADPQQREAGISGAVTTVQAGRLIVFPTDTVYGVGIDEFSPGPLTLVFRASSTLKWDLGDTNGTVAIRMPLHPVALELLRRTGPLAVSSANKSGVPAA